MSDDPYAILGVAKDASADDIKKAYRKRVRGSHPDLHPDDPGAEDRFKSISAAHDLLKNPDTRARFDAGEIDASGAERPQRRYYRDYAEAPGHAYQKDRDFGADIDPADIFADILRQRQAGGQRGTAYDSFRFSAPGPDIRYQLEISFLDAAKGNKTRIILPTGETLEVQVPRGAADGQTLRLRGKGGPGHGDGPPGDALITLSVRPHPVFQRRGDDIIMTLPITMDEAVLGARVTVPTIDGKVHLNISPGASGGQTLRLRGRGVRRPGGPEAGDQRVELRIVMPPKIDDRLMTFMQEWRKSNAHDPRKGLFEETPQ